jgi:hypothetical protein
MGDRPRSEPSRRAGSWHRHSRSGASHSHWTGTGQCQTSSKRCCYAICKRSSAKAIRRAAIEDLYTEDCVVHSPTGRHVGRQALDQIAGELRADHPTFVYTPHTIPQAVQNGGRIAWGSGPAGEPPRYTGLDVIIARDGKIAALYVFLDSPPV